MALSWTVVSGCAACLRGVAATKRYARYQHAIAAIAERLTTAAEAEDIDAVCPTEGCVDNNPKRRLASLQKNNLCATNKPVPVLLTTFDQLQRAADNADIPSGGPSSFPDDRSEVQDLITVNGQTLGEGQVVTLAAWVMEALLQQHDGWGECELLPRR